MDWSSWLIVGVFLALTFGLGLWFARRANQNTSEYFLSGRTLPWWVLGTSMVVTTFAPDTPLGVAEYARSGVYNGWFGWNLVMAQILAVFLFSRLWRRSGVLTDNELIELRYSGRPAAGLRLFKALHFSILANLLSLSLVINAIVTVLQSVLDVSAENMEWLRIGVAGVAVTYALIAGFWGVVATDFLQFWIAVIGTAVFAWIAADHLGGMGPATKALSDASLSFFPDSGPDLNKILVYVGIMWWGMYNADGGGYLAQRMLAAKDERHASLGTLWFSVAYAAIRMWPWIVIGTLSLALYPMIKAGPEGELPRVNGVPSATVSGTVVLTEKAPDGTLRTVERQVAELPIRSARSGATSQVITDDSVVVESIKGKTAYPRMMTEVLRGHPWLVGLLLSAFLAAFLSTVDTLLNWGGSYLVHDVYARFINPKASEKAKLLFAKIAVLIIMAAAVFISRYFSSIRDAWIFTWAVSAGLGPVVILRWFWWRVNAWCEIGALTLSLVLAFGFEVLNAIYAPMPYRFAMSQTYVGDLVLEQWHKALLIVFGALLWCILGAFLAPPTERRRLAAFVERVRPPGAWEAIRREVGAQSRPDLNVRSIIVLWVFGVSFVYGCTFFVGGLIYGKLDTALWAVLAAGLGGIGIAVSFRRDARRARAAEGHGVGAADR